MVRLYPGLLSQSLMHASLKVTEDVTQFVVVDIQRKTATSICEILFPLKCIRILWKFTKLFLFTNIPCHLLGWK